MAVIFCLKQGRMTPAPEADILKSADYAALLTANAALEAAQAEAARIRAEAEAVYAAERERGYAEGLEEGKAEMAERTFEAISRGVDFVENLESSTVDIVMRSLERLLGDMPPKDVALGLVRKSLAYVRGQKQVTLRVCPEEADWVRAEVDALGLHLLGVGLVRVVADRNLQTGACLLESDLGLIDASLKVQMAALRRAFNGQLKQR